MKIRLHKLVLDLVRDGNLEYSKHEIQKNIGNYGVYVGDKNSNLSDDEYSLIYNRLQWILPDQLVNIDHWPSRDVGNFDDVKVIQETDSYLVVFKPPNVVVEEGAGHILNNLKVWLEKKYNKELFLIHRLDKNTQGVMIIGKNQKTQEFIQNQFRERSVLKRYLAVVDNSVDNLWKITNWQARDKINPTKQIFLKNEAIALKYDPKSRKAISEIKPVIVCSETNQSLIEITIKTGRMHQIRLQCEVLGFPILNEKIYRRDKKLSQNELLDFKYQEITAKRVTKSSFDNIIQYVFGNYDSYLISNYLKLLDENEGLIEIEYKSIDKIYNQI